MAGVIDVTKDDDRHVSCSPEFVVTVDQSGALSGVKIECAEFTFDLTNVILKDGTELRADTEWSVLTANILVDRVEVKSVRAD